MKRLFNVITKKSVTALILFLIEIILSGFVVLFLGRSFLIFGVLVYFFDIDIIFFIVNGRSNLAYKVSWIFNVVLLPFVGGVLYLTFGKRRTVKKFKKKFIAAEYSNLIFFKDNKICFLSLQRSVHFQLPGLAGGLWHPPSNLGDPRFAGRRACPTSSSTCWSCICVFSALYLGWADLWGTDHSLSTWLLA